jgi:hypothetical protein
MFSRGSKKQIQFGECLIQFLILYPFSSRLLYKIPRIKITQFCLLYSSDIQAESVSDLVDEIF